MEEKNVKMSLGTSICICIIVILLCVIVGMWCYFTKNNNSKTDEKTNTTIEKSSNNGLNEVENNTIEESDEDVIVKSLPKNIKKDQDDSKNIIMYTSGMNIANKKPDTYSFDYETKKFPDYYNTTYDMYQNGKKIGETNGKIKGYFDEMFDETCYYIDFEKQDPESAKKTIFVSCNYDVVPRNYENINNIPDNIKSDFANNDSLKMQGVDLDGDGKKEYIVAYSENKDSMEHGKAGVYLYDSNYKKISMIATQTSYTEYLSSFDNITYMDIDKDGNMEIIISIPVASSYIRFGIYEYKDGSVKGQIDTFGIGG